MKKYWLINVMGDDGYSILVHCEAKTADDAIDMARKADLFENFDDWRIASAEEADEDTIAHFKEWDLLNEL